MKRLKDTMSSLSVILLLALASATAMAQSRDDMIIIEQDEVAIVTTPSTEISPQPDTSFIAALRPFATKPKPASIYELPYSLKTSSPDWHRMWINTAVLSGAFVGTLFVLELLPEDATSWNRADLQKDPFYRRWVNNIFHKGPEWDHDKFIFNYVLHPYAGAAYFMAARSCGFNYFQSLLYATCISTVGWEFGIEACMERPSIQDIFITPIVGSIFGELFYKLKRNIVGHDYTLFGSRVVGNIVVFLIDPVNEVVNLFRSSDTRKLHLGRKERPVYSSLMPTVGRGSFGMSFTCIF